MAEIKIPDNIYQEFEKYCELNEIQDFEKEFCKIFVMGFNVLKYGTSPFKPKPQIENNVLINKEPEVKKEEPKQVTEKPKKQVRIIKN